MIAALQSSRISIFLPNYSKAILSARRILKLLDTLPVIDSYSTEGLKPVSRDKLHVHTYIWYIHTYMHTYVTGFWKTVTLGQLHFLGPANSHTHTCTLSIHCCNTRLSCLVCFSRAGFVDHVKLQLRQWDPWRALDGRYGSDIHICVSEISLRPSRLV